MTNRCTHATSCRTTLKVLLLNAILVSTTLIFVDLEHFSVDHHAVTVKAAG
jgi:hypothetical protein